MPSQIPDYYRLLGVSKSANQDEIRTAYKKESLKTHPDRLVNATPTEKQKATEKFQAVADAYYVLSDPDRRKEYDLLYAANRPSSDPSSSSNFFTQFSSMFGGGGATGTASAQGNANNQPDAEGVFADVFEELLRPEVERRAPWWAYVGAACGAGIGFIIANFPGLMLGSVAGHRLGAIRDAKGKSVAAVFTQLGGDQKAEILKALAMKVLGSAM
ncbi:DnaJ-domain-containing protein [Dendrothele bispora CBS 962.96]|uniref:DnaJ-domain-containing protein n=1 Tax=Dendrothele bispora (strain CBS 962.96) TaxID=1314807 RepID=A0A4S8LRX7_DENBC|nr:DnaJ-domain-containing protein [Dendrothele bispora CBS 962.96]